MDRYVYFSSDDAQAALVAASAGQPAKLSKMKNSSSVANTPADFTISDFEFKRDFQNTDPWEVALTEFITEDFSSDSEWGYLCTDAVVESTLVGNRYVQGVLGRVQLKSPGLRTVFHPEVFMSAIKIPTKHSSYRFTLIGENRQPVNVKSGRILITLHFRRTPVRRDANSYQLDLDY